MLGDTRLRSRSWLDRQGIAWRSSATGRASTTAGISHRPSRLSGRMDEQGYQVLRGAVDAQTIDAYTREREAARDGLLARERGAEHVELLAQASEDAGAVDPYAIVGA